MTGTGGKGSKSHGQTPAEMDGIEDIQKALLFLIIDLSRLHHGSLSEFPAYAAFLSGPKVLPRRRLSREEARRAASETVRLSFLIPPTEEACCF